MTLPLVVSREEWLEARKALLAEEKAMTHARDALSTKRRELPMVSIDKEYVFDAPGGTLTLLDLFEGARQLIVQHFMFDPAWQEGCPSCTAGAEEVSPGLLRHLRARDTSFAAVSRAPLVKLQRYKAEKGWTFTWVSSLHNDFNYDFNVTIDASKRPIMWNYRNLDELKQHGLGRMADGSSEQPGHSMFLRDGDTVFHTYSMYARGAEQLGGSYYFLDLTSLGRQEEWEEPKGRAESARAAIPNFAT